MAESADYDPGPWKGHDFGKARTAAYDANAGRSYKAAVSAGKPYSDYIEPRVSTLSSGPLVIVCDVTGSMGEWPAEIFGKLPFLDTEIRDYLGPDAEICFAAVGDANKQDQYPLQVRKFGKGLELAERLTELVVEGGGGGGGDETYELAALYFATMCDMPNAVTPIIIFIGDEHPYDAVTKAHAKQYVGIDLEDKTLSTKTIFAQLQEKFNAYHIRKSFGDQTERDTMTPYEQRAYDMWAGLIGADHIAFLPKAERVVDVIFGILAKETGRIDDFRAEIEVRQKPGQVATVYKSLATVLAIDDVRDRKALPKGGSRLHGSDSGKSSTSLM